MRFIQASGIIAAAWLAAGCTPMQWVKADATPEQLNHDSMQCQQNAWRESRLRSWSWYHRPIGPMVSRDARGRRFVVWPSRPFYDPFGDPFFEESRLTNFCMRSKGYELMPVEKPKEQVEPKK